MNNEYKEWLQEQTFETLATDNYNVKLLLLAEQAKNKKLVEALEAISKAHSETTQRIMQYANQALNEVNNDSKEVEND